MRAISSRLTRQSLLEIDPELWAGAIIFVLLCVTAAAMYFVHPETPRRMAAALVLTAIASVTLMMVLRHQARVRRDGIRGAAAVASSANLAWAVTDSEGCLIDCNAAYRTLASGQGKQSPDPPLLGFRGEQCRRADVPPLACFAERDCASGGVRNCARTDGHRRGVATQKP